MNITALHLAARAHCVAGMEYALATTLARVTAGGATRPTAQRAVLVATDPIAPQAAQRVSTGRALTD